MTRKHDPFREAFAHLPAGPSERLQALVDINRRFRHALADHLTPVVRTLVQEAPPADDAGRKHLVHQLNATLHDFGLAIANPESGHASTLVTEPYRIVLQTRAMTEDGRRTRSKNVKSLPPLELVEHVRPEPMLTWRERLQRKPPEERGPRR